MRRKERGEGSCSGTRENMGDLPENGDGEENRRYSVGMEVGAPYAAVT
jgi:hypothetical protein